MSESTWNLDERELSAVKKMTAQERYQYSVVRIVEYGTVWCLGGPDGLVLAADETGRDLLPIWPHATLAAACATETWAGNAPQAITLDAWLNKWLPGLDADGRLVAVLPLPTQKAGAVVSPEQMKADLEEEMKDE